MSKFGLDTDVLEKLCKEHDLLLSDPLLNLVSDVIEIVCNEEKEKNYETNSNKKLTA